MRKEGAPQRKGALFRGLVMAVCVMSTLAGLLFVMKQQQQARALLLAQAPSPQQDRDSTLASGTVNPTPNLNTDPSATPGSAVSPAPNGDDGQLHDLLPGGDQTIATTPGGAIGGSSNNSNNGNNSSSGNNGSGGGTIAPSPTRTPALKDVSGYPVVGKLSVERLSIELPVIGEISDAALKVSLCLYAGPSSPEYAGNIVLTGHNNRDKSQFGRLAEIRVGDNVMLMDRYGASFAYQVYDVETIEPDDMAALERYEGDHALALVTCTSSGKKRLLVRCKMVSN